ncbi:MAG: metallophosphoesterase family protein [Methanobacteriota archaeon]
MKLALISDVHSNLPALEAVLAEIRRMGIARILHAGDVVGYNAFPNEVIALFAREKIESIKGNHEIANISGDWKNFNQNAALAEEWTHKNLSMQSSVYLTEMPEHLELKIEGLRIAVHHGAPFDPDKYIMQDGASSDLLRKAQADVLVLGHTHWPFVSLFGKGYVINPGSVGQPRDGDWRASFATLDIKDRTVTDASIHRLVYSVSKTMLAGRKAGLPQRLIDRLEKGN